MLLLTRPFGVTTSDVERRLDVEADYAKEIVTHVLRMQAHAATEQRRGLCRGTHAKGVCVRAEFEVLDVSAGRDGAMAERLAKGIFAFPGVYPATVRFANSDPAVNSDWKRDVRAMSFTVDLTGTGGEGPVAGVARQDFAMQSAPTLPLNDVPAFLATMKVLTASNPLKGLWSLSLRDRLRVVRALALAQAQSHRPTTPYQQLRYWSTVPFQHGEADTVKQSAIPAPANASHPLQRRNADMLRGELIRHVNEDAIMSSFDVGLQFLDADRMTYWGKRYDPDFWIENASVEWKEADAPFHKVARLTLLPRSVLSAEESEEVYFDVTAHAAPGSGPVGGINRARWRSEAASRERRMAGDRAAGSGKCPF